MTKIKITNLKVGDAVRCISNGGREFQLMHSQRNRLVIGKVYIVRWVDYFNNEIGLKNKRCSWQSKRFKKVKLNS
jgi:hypothetical protein